MAATRSTRVVPQIRTLRDIAFNNPSAQRALETEAALYMDGRDDAASWVMEDHRSGTVLDWEEVRGYGFILEDNTGDKVFVNRRADKRLNEPNWRHNLIRGERVTFAKTKGLKGFWVAGVKRIEQAATIDDNWEDDTLSSFSNTAAIASTVPAAFTGERNAVAGSVYVQGDASVQITNHASPNPYIHRGHSYSRARGPGLSRDALPSYSHRGMPPTPGV